MPAAIYSLWNTVLELLYPSHCVICECALPERELLCSECNSRLPRIASPHCQICSLPYPMERDLAFTCANCEDRSYAFRCAVSKFRAHGIMRELVHRLKYNGQFYLRRVLAGCLLECFQDSRIREEAIDALVPVPLHPARLRERGYNQSQAISEIVAKQTEIPMLTCLRRRRYTETQTHFDRNDRMRNLHNAFELSEDSRLRGKRVLLVDDVLTTGSTLNECARVLLQNGAASVRAVTVARG